MKKLTALVLALTCVLGMVGCNKSIHHGVANEPSASETVEEDITSFSAKVLEVNNNYLLAEPLADSNERKTADKIEVPLVGKISWPIPAVGDMVNVFYNGGIQETYPARIAKVHRVEIETSTSNTEPDSEIPGATTFIVDIWDRAKEEQLDCDDALEKFYEDETTEYYFSCIKSHYIMVMDNTGRTVDIITALNEGLASIADLDYYGIKYLTEPRSEIVDDDAVEVPKGDIITDVYTPNLNMRTLKSLVDRYGEDLTWDEFDTYYSENIGSGLYILRYPIGMDYSLLIGGGSMDCPPMYIRLVSEYDTEVYIDVRTDSIDDFVNSAPKTEDFSYDEILKTYKENDPGVKCDGFNNTSRVALERISDVIKQAENECTINYTVVNVSYDSNAYVWEVLFWSGTPGGGQTVYMDCFGVTNLIVYGE